MKRGITRKFWQIDRPTGSPIRAPRKSEEEKLRKTRRRLILRPFSRIHFSPLFSPPPFFFFRSPIVSLHCEKKKNRTGRGRFVDRPPFLIFLNLPWNLFARGSRRFLSSFSESKLYYFFFKKNSYLDTLRKRRYDGYSVFQYFFFDSRWGIESNKRNVKSIHRIII